MTVWIAIAAFYNLALSGLAKHVLRSGWLCITSRLVFLLLLLWFGRCGSLMIHAHTGSNLPLLLRGYKDKCCVRSTHPFCQLIVAHHVAQYDKTYYFSSLFWSLYTCFDVWKITFYLLLCRCQPTLLQWAQSRWSPPEDCTWRMPVQSGPDISLYCLISNTCTWFT